MLIISYIGDQVWLMTSRQTLPDLGIVRSPDVFGHLSVRDSQLVDVGMEYPICETDTGALIRVLVRKLDMYFPASTSEGSLFWAFEPDVELLHIVVDQGDLIVTHEQLHHVPDTVRHRLLHTLLLNSRLDAPLRRTHPLSTPLSFSFQSKSVQAIVGDPGHGEACNGMMLSVLTRTRWSGVRRDWCRNLSSY